MMNDELSLLQKYRVPGEYEERGQIAGEGAGATKY
jgi:hypothetical protein